MLIPGKRHDPSIACSQLEEPRDSKVADGGSDRIEAVKTDSSSYIWRNLYRARLDDLYFCDFLAGETPSEIREVMRLVDPVLSEVNRDYAKRVYGYEPDAAPLFGKVRQIIGEIIQKNDLDPAVYEPELWFSLSGSSDCVVMRRSKGKRPLLAIPFRLLSDQIETVDELAASIAKAIAQQSIIERSDVVGSDKEKLGELNRAISSSADLLAVELLDKAGFNPNALISLARKIAPKFEQKYDLSRIFSGVTFGELISFFDREKVDIAIQVRNLETAIAALNRQKGVTNSEKAQEPFERKLWCSLYPFVRAHSDPLAAALQRSALQYGRSSGEDVIGFSDLPANIQVELVLDILMAAYPPLNSADAFRYQSLLRIISGIPIDFSDRSHVAAFERLANFATTKFPYETKVVPPPGVTKYDIERDLVAAVEDIWIHRNPDEYKKIKELMSKANFEPKPEVLRYNIQIGLNRELQKQFDELRDASTAEEAEIIAGRILDLGGRACASAKGFRTFYPTSSDDVTRAIAEEGIWIPPYAKLASWCGETGVDNLKELMYALSLDLDPWVLSRLDTKPKTYLRFYNIPSSNYDYKNLFRIPDRAAAEQSRAFFSTLERDENGSATGIIERSPIYIWDSRSRLSVAEHAQQREAHDLKLCQEADWTLLAQNFKRFVAIHGRNLIPNQSSSPIRYHFAERFYNEIQLEWANGNLEFQSAVKGYFSRVIRHPHFSAYWDTNERERLGETYTVALTGDLASGELDVYPTYKLDHPLIRFMFSSIGREVFSEKARLQILTEVDGFATEENLSRPISQMFAVPLDQLLDNYPRARSLNDLFAYLEKDIFSYFERNPKIAGIAIAAEAERIAMEQRDSISVADLITVAAFLVDGQCQHHYDNPVLYANRSLARVREISGDVIRREFQHPDIERVIESYRLAQTTRILRNDPKVRVEAQTRIMTELPSLSLDKQITLLGDILRPEDLSPQYCIDDKRELLLKGRFKYSAIIDEPEFREWLVDQYTSVLVASIGVDDGTESQSAKAKEAIDRLCANTTGLTRVLALERFAEKVNAQMDVAFYARERYVAEVANNAKTRELTCSIGELAINETNRDQKLADQILDFLSVPATLRSADPLLRSIQQKKSKLVDGSDQAIYASLENMHKNFWSATLEMRVIYLEKIAFPDGTTAEQQRKKVQSLIGQSFPIENLNSQRCDNWYAQNILLAYFNEADLPEQRLLAAAILAADMREAGVKSTSVGKKLYTILSHMGPAGAKLLQAIHSHPEVPEHIKRDIADAKVMFDPPKRWETIQILMDCGLLDKERADCIDYIGRVEGAGAFGVTTFNRLESGLTVADTLLRRHAADRADREFGMMRRATAALVQGVAPELKPAFQMIGDAQDSARVETNMSLAGVADSLAVDSYGTIRVTVLQDGVSYPFEHKVAQLLEHGDGFKRCVVAPGIHFNKLPTNTPAQLSYKKAVAKSMIAAQLALRLAGKPTDRDRHGGNINVLDLLIYHFDFGSMSLDPITAEDRAITGKLLAQVISDVNEGIEINTALSSRINSSQVSEDTRRYLNGMRKDLLALGDYVNVLDSHEMTALVASALISKTVHQEIDAAFRSEVGIKWMVVWSIIRSRAKESGVTVEFVA